MARGISYTEKQTEDSIWKELKGDVSNIYKANCLKWQGSTSDTAVFYTEHISKILLANLLYLNTIPKITRKTKYRIRDTNSITKKINSSKKEENFAKSLVNEDLLNLGIVKDFQIPIRGVKSDSAGKVDLLSWDINTKTIYLIEYKHNNNKETLLRAIMEIFTYFKQIQHEQIEDEYKPNKKFMNKNIQIKPVVLVYEGSHASLEAKGLNYGMRPYLRKLCLALGVEVYTLNYDIKRM